ncbi:MAG TPA: 3-phosphoshikimate 1-carboxyvinyltransferase [Lachnospiraceae bacterium]|nr:3-phosphoshikimate 1-carboxyvinyltransferase [Lachnospiraceae bacterium]
MDVYKVQRIKEPVDICVEVPGSKSITNRALLLAAMGDCETLLKGVQFSEDSYNFLKAIKELGFKTDTDEAAKSVRITGMNGLIPASEASIYVGSAGTAARFLTAFTAMGNGIYTLDSSEQMKKRPMKELLEVLENLGAKFTWLGEEYNFPMKVTGIRKKILEDGFFAADRTVSLNIDRSSQFLSALLMTAPAVFNFLAINLTGSRDARSYVEITEQMMKQFGHRGVERLGQDTYRVLCGHYHIKEYQIEPDVSAACYFYAIAAATGGTAIVKHIRKDSLQGDMKFIDVLKDMGCHTEWTDDGELKLYAPENRKLKGIDVNMADFSDQALTLAAIAPFADSPVTIRGVAHIRGQESDRIAVIVNELGRMNIKCDELEDGVIIYPGTPLKTMVHTYNDHRVAMAFTVTGMAADGIEIENPMCCKKTFADFFNIVSSLYK